MRPQLTACRTRAAVTEEDTMPHPVVDLREKQPWLMVPKAAMDVLAELYLSYPGELPVKEAGEEILRVAESFLAKVLLERGHDLGMLYGYRTEIERRAREEAFRDGIAFAVSVLRRFAKSPQDTSEWQKVDSARRRAAKGRSQNRSMSS